MPCDVRIPGHRGGFVMRLWLRVFPVCLILLLLAWLASILRDKLYFREPQKYLLDRALYNISLLSNQTAHVTKQWHRHTHPSCHGHTVAVGVALSFRGISTYTQSDVPLSETPFFRDLLPSFCYTASHDYCYTLFVAYDYNDVVMSLPEGRFTFINNFRHLGRAYDDCFGSHKVNLQFVECNYTGRPAWSQNEAMMAAYQDKFDYYLMANDDTLFTTITWTEKLVDILIKMSPPNVGTTGPTQIGGNEDIMTYNFVHRTHIDIFGYFYPPVFHTWSADEWMTKVYEPDHSFKHPGVIVLHVQELGQRYQHTLFPREELEVVLDRTRGVLRKYLWTQRFKRNVKNR